MRIGPALAVLLLGCGVALADPPWTVERLLGEGWDVAGYVSGYDNRSSLILFRHTDKTFLVQCAILYDVARNPRTIINCYDLR